MQFINVADGKCRVEDEERKTHSEKSALRSVLFFILLTYAERINSDGKVEYPPLFFRYLY